MTPILAFNIATIPDTEGLRTVYGTGEHANAEQLAEIAFQQGRQSHVQDHLPLHLHRIAAVSCTLRDDEHFHVWSTGNGSDGEATLIQQFFDAIAKHKPQSVSWYGTSFDLPLLVYRTIIHDLTAPRQWGIDKHDQHLSLMDEMACRQPTVFASRYDMAKLCGLPAMPEQEPNQLWQDWQAGRVDEIRQRNEIDALNTHLLYLRYERLRGNLTAAQYQSECELIKNSLILLDAPHWIEYLLKWQTAA
ncbi:MAG: 3'-5' exonuclease [Sulfuriferula sp.]|nr:3'-5' exonuclease [Sulfuriferula sp.]